MLNMDISQALVTVLMDCAAMQFAPVCSLLFGLIWILNLNCHFLMFLCLSGLIIGTL